MPFAKRTKQGLEEWFTRQEEPDRPSWSERIRGWFANVIGFGVETALDVIGKKAAPTIAPVIERIESETEIPPELKPMIDELKNPTGEWSAVLAQSAGGALIGGALGRVIDYILRPLTYGLSYSPKFHILEPAQLIALWLRGAISDEDLASNFRWLGIGTEGLEQLQSLAEIRFDPATIMQLYRRDREKYDYLWEDLEHQGWDKNRLEAYKVLADIVPPLADMVRFADYSGFDPEVIERWREFYDAPEWIRTPMALLGVTGEWANKYWFSHWRQPGRFELGEMHRRGLIDDDAVKLAYKTMGYSSYWQGLLLDLVRAVPTRVDVRRWWDMGTIDEARLKEIYHAQGYYDKDLDDYVLWTKVYVAFPDLIARYKNGWITLSEVESELTSLEMPPARAKELIETKFKKVQTERVATERGLTVTDIIKGVKTGVITRNEGQQLLEEMGYDAEEAKFKLDINIPVGDTIPEIEEKALTKTEIINAFKLGQIDEAETISRLMTIPYSEDNARFLLNLVKATMAKIEEVKERNLTKTDIVKGVKKGVITPEEGYLMLTSIGYSGSESDFILEINIEAPTGSPSTFNEFLALTQSYRASQGLSVKEVKPEVIQAEKEVKIAIAALQFAKDNKAKPKRIKELELKVEQAKQRYHQLIASPEVTA